MKKTKLLPSEDFIELREIALRLIEKIKQYRKRYFLLKLMKSMKREPRIKLLRGFRGAGKTTALLQIFAEKQQESMYFSMDNPLIKNYGLYQIGKTSLEKGFSILLIDEAHTYPNWRNEVKALYDEFPKAKFIVSGSAPLVFVPERREEEINADFLGLGEFVFLKTGKRIQAKEEWKVIENSIKLLIQNPELKQNWEAVLYNGLPIYFEYGEATTTAIFNSIRKSIRQDTVFFLKMSGEKIVAMENFLRMLATSSLGEFSINSCSKNLGVSKFTMYEIINILNEMQIIHIIRPYGRGPKMVRGEPKIMFRHPCLRTGICKTINEEPNLGAIREEMAVFSFISRGYEVYTIKGKKKSPDYVVKKGKEILITEIGGESKTKIQLAEFPKRKTLILKPRQQIVLATF
ncbi:hypothetical protein DRZ77_00435 [Candidatus Woesearchaeota archaeon]|nr:AAA family ATPase [Candidatus Woesearchaeota archaeon]RLE41060.1 MAG: hypothetical protein DRZ77_00435 [Candidatus Woesearchaeota archaeon]